MGSLMAVSSCDAQLKVALWVLATLDPTAVDTDGQLACAGAVVFALTQAVEQGHAATYNTLLRAMRHSLKNGPQHFAKIPELSASWDFDLNRSFLL